MRRPLGAQISHMLKARGCEVIFGIPGVHNQEMYRGIEEAGLTHVLARHEQGAAFMADGYARASGKPGVAYVITGPGLCNALTPLGQSYSDSVPVLAISSCLDETAARRGQLHQMRDQRAAAEAVCDWSEEARSAEAAYALVDRAFTEFATSRPRSKHIQVPIGILEAPADPSWPDRNDPLPARPAPTADGIERVADLIRNARKPLFIFGGGAARASKAAQVVLQRAGAASFCTYAGRGIVSPETPYYLGSALARPDSAAVCAEADLLVTVGTELAEVDLWRAHPGHTCPHVCINIDPEELTRRDGAGVGLLADAQSALMALADALSGHIATTGWRADRIADCRARWRAETDAERPGIVPLCDSLRAQVPDDTMIYSDMTQFAYVAKEVWDMTRPGHWHHPFGFGTLGYALPAAIGGAVARPAAPTLAIIGDYGFQYTCAELGVAVELGLPLPIILWDNGKLKEIEDSMTRAQIAPNAVTARNPDFCRLAEAYGAYAVAPRTAGALQSAVNDAFSADRPTLIHLQADVISTG